MKRIIITFITIFSFLNAFCNLQLNEIVQSNFKGVFAGNAYPDSWVEIANCSDNPMLTLGYSISPSPYSSDAYPIPLRVLEPGDAMVIYCDKGTTDAGFVPFRLDAERASLFLFGPGGAFVDRLDYPPMADTDIAYARAADGSWSTVAYATPGNAVNAPAVSAILPDPEFSREGGVWPIGALRLNVTVSIPDEIQDKDVRLCVSIDGSEPTLQHAREGRSYTRYISSNIVLRARLISETGTAASRAPLTQSYIFLKRPANLDVVSIATDDSCMFAPGTGILHPDFDPYLEVRRPINIEYFKSDGTRLFNQRAETRIQGGITRTYSQKSLAVYASKRFGKKKFKGVIWPDKPEVDGCKSLILRNGGNSWSFQRFNDQVMQDLVGRAKPTVDRMACVEALYYINGRFMGITDVRERSNEDFIEANYPDMEDFDMVENYTSVKAGDDLALRRFMDYYNSPEADFVGLLQHMDIDNFLDSFVMRIFAGDTDHPQNNIAMWRPRATGGRWRMVIKDVDRGGLWSIRDEVGNDYLTHIDNLCAWYPATIGPRVRLFKLMYTLPELREMLIDRVAVSAGDYLHPEAAAEVIDGYVEQCSPFYADHMNVYRPGNGVNATLNWKNYNDYWKNTWWPARIEAVYTNLASRFALGDTFPLSIDPRDHPLTINNVAMTRPTFDGKWFTGRRLALSTDDDAPCAWVVETTLDDGFISGQRLYGSTMALDGFPAGTRAVRIYLDLNPATSDIDEISAAADATPASVYDLQGRPVSNPRRGQLYIVNGQKIIY